MIRERHPTIHDRFTSDLKFRDLMDRLGLNVRQCAHIIADGFQNMQDLIEHYEVTGPKEFE